MPGKEFYTLFSKIKQIVANQTARGLIKQYTYMNGAGE